MSQYINDLARNIMADVAAAFWTYVAVVLLAFAYAFVMRRCEGWRSKIFTKQEIDKIKEKL